MKFLKRFTLLFFLTITCLTNLCANSLVEEELTGVELCDEVYNFLDDNSLFPIAVDLLSSGENNFPYNIEIEINVDSENNSSQNFIFTFFQEDVLDNKKLIIDLINFIKEQNFDFNTTILFSYGEKPIIEKEDMIYGIDSFLENINTSDDYTNIIVDLASNQNKILTSSEGTVAPSWLIQNEFNLFIKYNLNENIPFFYLSQLHTFDFFYNRLLSSFYKYDVATLKLNFNKETKNNDTVLNILKDSITEYNRELNRSWDHHFFMMRIGNKFYKLTEENTVKIIIFIIFLWLLFLFLFFFINARLKKQAWGSTKHIWYCVPITYILTILGFIVGKYVTLLFFDFDNSISYTFTLTTLQLIFSIILVSIYYAITLLYNFSFYEKSIDYLIVVSCFINQSFFILIDISLFPIFMVICMLSIFALSIKKNSIHIIIFFLMTLPFIPYVIAIINNVNFDALYVYIINNPYVNIFVPMILYPSLLIYFRVLVSIRRKTKINIPILTGIIIIFLSLVIIFSGMIKKNSLLKNKVEDKEKYILATPEDLISINYNDQMIFDDIIRTLNINFNEKPIQCNVTVTSITGAPILYTENAFEFVTATSSEFKVPSNPPSELSFKYGAQRGPSIITVSAIFNEDGDSDYKTTKKVVTIGTN